MDSELFVDWLSISDKYFLDLHTAASFGCEERVRDILENSENRQVINAQNIKDWTPLMYASCCVNLQVVLILLEEGANTNLKNNLGQTALTLASKCGSTDIVGILLDNGARINEKDIKGWTALFHATAFNHGSVVQLLIEKGAIVDAMDKNRITPLMFAAAAGHEMIVKDLLQYGADPSIISKAGETAIDLAIRNGHSAVKNLINSYLRYRKQRIPAIVQNTDLFSLLKDHQLSKYYPIFEKQDIDLDSFVMLSDEDLQNIGIKLLGPRKKIRSAITHLLQDHPAVANSEDKTSKHKLLTENQKLHQQLAELKELLSREKDLRIVADRKFQEGIQTFKNFTDAVHHTISNTIHLQEKLKEEHNNLIKLLCSTSECMSFRQRTKFNIDAIFKLLECEEKLMDDVRHQSMLCLTQTSFRR